MTQISIVSKLLHLDSNILFTLNSLASFSLWHRTSGPFAFVAVANAWHNCLHVESPSWSHLTTRLGVWLRIGKLPISGVVVGNPPHEQLPFDWSSRLAVLWIKQNKLFWWLCHIVCIEVPGVWSYIKESNWIVKSKFTIY